MLKRYYTVLEAAEFLSEQTRTSIGSRDVIELAAREDLRFCFWVDKPIQAFDFFETPLPFCYEFRGYVQILPIYISPGSKEFEITKIRKVVEVIEEKASVPPNGKPIPSLTFGDNGSTYGSSRSVYFATMNGLLNEVSTEQEFIQHGTFRLSIEDIFVPAVDLLRLRASEGYLGALASAPWPKHETEKLRALRTAAVRFWSNYDPNDPTTAPKNEAVIEWLETEYKGLISSTLANYMATILRADGLKTGPR